MAILFVSVICKETDEAVALFGDKEVGSIVLLKGYDAYYHGYDENGKHQPGYTELISELSQDFPLGQAIIETESKKISCVCLVLY